LRQGFSDTLHDPDFVAEAARTGLEVEFVSGDDVQRLVERLNSLPQDIVERAQKMLAAK
jgi:hypothetical protein